MSAVYKVVHIMPDGSLKSCTVFAAPYAITYEIHEWAVPAIGKIFAFDNLFDAEDFASVDYCNGVRAIFKAEAMGEEPIRAVLQLPAGIAPTELELDLFWHSGKGLKLPAPKGTVACNNLMLLKRIK